MNALDETRMELLAALAEVSRLRPQWRLGQLVANLATTAGRLDSGGIWELDDTEALAAAKTLIEQSPRVNCEAAPQETAVCHAPANDRDADTSYRDTTRT